MNYISTKTRKFAVMALAALSLLALIGYPPAWAQEKPNVTVCGTCKQDPCTKCNACGTHSQSGKTHTKAACGSHNKCDSGSHDKKHPCNTHYKCDTASYPDGHGACKVSGCSEGGYLCNGDHATAGCNVKGHTNCDGKTHTQCTESGCELLLCDGHKHCKAVGCYATPPHDPCQNPNCGKYECECNCHKCSDCDSYDVTECPHSCGNGMGSVSGDKVYHCDTHMCKCTYDQSGDDCSYDGQTSFTYKADTYGASFDVSSLIKVKTGTSAKCQCGESGPNGKHTIKFSPQTVDMTSAASQKADKVYSIKVSCEDCSFTKTVKITNKHVCAFGHSACTYVKLSGGKSSFIHHPDGTEEEVVANVAIKSPINLSAEVYECCQYCHKKGQTLSGTWAGVNGSKIQFNKVGTDKQVLYVDSNNRNNAFGGLKFNVYCDAHEPGSVTVTPHDAVLCDTVPDGNGWMAQGSFNAKLEKCAKCGKDEFNSFSTKWTISGATPSKTSGQGLSTGTINFRGFDSGSVKFTAKATGSSSSSVEVSGEEHFKVEHTHNWVGATNQTAILLSTGSVSVEPATPEKLFIQADKKWDGWQKIGMYMNCKTVTPARYKKLVARCSKCNAGKYSKPVDCGYSVKNLKWLNVPADDTYTKKEIGDKDLTAEFEMEAEVDGTVLHTIKATGTRKAGVWYLDLDADVNRDGNVDSSDDDSVEGSWSNNSGAIYMVNCDDDNGDGEIDGLDLADDGSVMSQSTTIEDEEDLKDIAKVVIQKLGADISSKYKVFLKIDDDREDKYNDVNAVNVFAERKVGAEVVVGRSVSQDSQGTQITSQKEADITGYISGTKETELGVEGLLFEFTGDEALKQKRYFDGAVRLEVEVRKDGHVIASDAVRLECAPWLMLARSDDSQVAYAGKANDGGNASLLDPNNGLGFSGQLDTYDAPKHGDLWAQDHTEIGYTQFPGGEPTYVALGLPRDKRGWVKTKLLSKNFGFYPLGEENAYGAESGDFGGNLEVTVPSATNPLGRVVFGDKGSQGMRDFLSFRRLQKPMLTAPTKWLEVGHIDEVTSFLSDGTVVLADPLLAIKLLEDEVPVNQRHEKVFFAKGAATPKGGTVGGGTTTRLYDGPAHGNITVIDFNKINDGDTITIYESNTSSRTFEFLKSGNSSQSSDILVNISDDKSNTDVMNTLTNAINTASFSVKAIAEGYGKVHLWNTTKGTKGNKSIQCSNESAFSFVGMKNGKDDGVDFSTEQNKKYKLIRTFNYGTDKKPVDGQVGAISGWHDGWIEISKSWLTTSKILDSKENTTKTDGQWFTPENGGKYVLTERSCAWLVDNQQTPAIITVEELLADAEFLEIQQLASVKIGEIVEVFGNYEGRYKPDTAYKRVPSLFWGEKIKNDDNIDVIDMGVSFNPGPTNLQIVKSQKYVSKQFGPLNSANEDIFEKKIKEVLGTPKFIDNWNAYHRWKGGVHCGSHVKRKIPSDNWWNKLKKGE